MPSSTPTGTQSISVPTTWPTSPCDLLTSLRTSFEQRVKPAEFHDALSTFPSQSVVFLLALPQSHLTTSATVSADPARRALFSDPDVATLSSLNNNIQAVGLGTGVDTLAHYTTEVLGHLSRKQLYNLGKRSRAEIDEGSEPSPVMSPTMRSIPRSAAALCRTGPRQSSD